MDFVYQRMIEKSLSNVWAAITDSSVLEVHLPGETSVKDAGDNTYRVCSKISLGFLRPTVNIDVHLSRIVDNVSLDFEVMGKSMGASICTVGTIAITSTDAGSTDLEINAEIQTSGLLNQVDDSKIKTATAEFIDVYLSNVETGFNG